MAEVRLRGQLEKLAGGTSVLEIEAETVNDLLVALEGWILDERGTVRRHINVFVNGEQATPESPVGAKDRVEILPAISGG